MTQTVAFALCFAFIPTPAIADPGDLLQTFVNPNPSTEPPSAHFYGRPDMAAVGKNVVLGFPFDDTFGNDAGIAYLIDTRTGEVLRTFKSPNPVHGGTFGSDVAAVGNRVLISAYRESQPDKPPLCGAAYVFDASTGELLHTLQKPAPAEGDHFGWPVGVLGEDFLVSCPRDDTGAKDAGAVFLYDGSTGELLWAFRKPEPQQDDQFGKAIAAVRKDLLVGVWNDDSKGRDAGAAYLFDGSTGKVLQTFHNPVPDRKNGFGCAVAALEGNVLISDKNYHPPRANGGVVYLFDSVTGDVLRTFNNPAPAVNDGFGAPIAVMDGNVLVSAGHANVNGFNAGAVYLFDGSTGKHLNTFANPTPAWKDYFGIRVMGLGKNVLITATFDDTAGIDAGAVYLFEGGSSAYFAAGEPTVTLSKTPTTRLYVRTTPPGASVFLDKRPIGTSNGLFMVLPGDHKVTLELPGHETKTLPVKVVEGQVTRLKAQLNRKPR